MDISFQALGGGDEIGANSYLLKIDDTNIILDCGLHPYKKGAELFPDYKSIQNEKICCMIISHAHSDHIGSLPYLKFFPAVKIYSTKPTLDIIEVMLLNTSFLIQKDFQDNEYAWELSSVSNYTEEVVNLIPMFIQTKNYNEKVELENNISFEFFNAGHILGAASVLIKAGDKKIFYTGDINLRDQELIPKANLPKGKIDLIISETTNGIADSIPSYRDETQRLTKFINEIEGRGGSVLIPVFALGKSQEMLKRIYDLMTLNKIPTMPIYYSPMSKRINSIYDIYNYTIDRIEKGYKLSKIPVRELNREDLQKGEFYKRPSIILATSGMMIDRTSSYTIAKNFLSKKDFGIAVTGFCREGTPGYTIKNSKRYERIFLPGTNNGIDVLCTVRNFNFSSHTDKKGLHSIFNNLHPDKAVLIHGDEDARQNFSRELSIANKDIKILTPEKNKKYSI
jgi:Cft2 family RNA processing exonuclease